MHGVGRFAAGSAPMSTQYFPSTAGFLSVGWLGVRLCEESRSQHWSQLAVPWSAFPNRHWSSAVWGFHSLSHQVHREYLASNPSSTKWVDGFSGVLVVTVDRLSS